MNIFTYYKSPLGKLTIQANDIGLSGAWFEAETTQPDDLGNKDDNHPLLKQAVSEFSEYFSGKRQSFTVPIATKGTQFQQKVWQALQAIPFATTCCYQDLANAINNPKAVRAVGMANGKNPLSIIIPCHRVIGKNGSLTGYAGGVKRKQQLLKHEHNIGNMIT